MKKTYIVAYAFTLFVLALPVRTVFAQIVQTTPVTGEAGSSSSGVVREPTQQQQYPRTEDSVPPTRLRYDPANEHAPQPAPPEDVYQQGMPTDNTNTTEPLRDRSEMRVCAPESVWSEQKGGCVYPPKTQTHTQSFGLILGVALLAVVGLTVVYAVFIPKRIS